MIKNIIFLAIFLNLFLSLQAQSDIGFNLLNNRYKPAFGFSAGYENLRINEIVYLTENCENLASKIDWNPGTLFSLGLSISLSPTDNLKSFGFFIEGRTKHYFQMVEGWQTDRDWDNEGRELSFGYSPVNMVSGMENAGSAGIIISIKNKFGFDIFFEVMHKRYVLMAYDGYVEQDGLIYDLYGPTIQYFQEWFLMGGGIQARYGIRRVKLNINYSILPFIRGANIDYHYFRKNDINNQQEMFLSFEDYVRGGMYQKIGASVDININSNLTMTVFTEYESVQGSRGKTFIKTRGINNYEVWYSNTAGAGMSGFKAGVRAEVRL